MDALAIAALAIGGVVLALSTIDFLTRRGRGPAFLRRMGSLAFGTRRRAIASYETLVLALLLFWVLPALWADVGLLEYRMVYVLVMTVSAPTITYILMIQRFSGAVQHRIQPGEILERTIEEQFRAGSLDEFLLSILNKMRMTESDPVWTEFRHARERLRSRDDDVGLAFREASRRIEARQTSD